MSTLMRFTLGANVLVFEAGGTYPAKRTIEKMQVIDRTADGSLQVETLGIVIRTRVLSFALMSLVDYTGLIDWFLNIVDGGATSFTFTDEYGDSGAVKITNSIELIKIFIKKLQIAV